MRRDAVGYGCDASTPETPRPAGSTILREVVALALLATIATVLPGCYAGPILAGIFGSQSDGSSGGGTDALPVVQNLGAHRLGSQVLIQFELLNADAGKLGATVEYSLVSDDERAASTPVEVTRAGASMLGCTEVSELSDLTDILSGETVSVLWDAGFDLGSGTSSHVNIIVTPIEDGVSGVPFPLRDVLVGNTPATLKDVQITSGDTGNRILVSFDLIDEEGDPVTLKEVRIAAQPALAECGADSPDTEMEIPDSAFEVVPFDLVFSSSSGEGTPANFDLDVKRYSDSGRDGLRALSAPGFVGRVVVQMTLREHFEEDFCDAPAVLTPEGTLPEGQASFDNNERPRLELVFPAEGADFLPSGLIAFDYRVSDPEKNSVDIQVDIDKGDGVGFVPANEFPSPASDGRRNLDTSASGNIHRFLLDLTSHDVTGDVTVRFRAFDRECDEPVEVLVDGLSFSGLSREADIRVGSGALALTAGDYDGDGRRDLVVASRSAGRLSVLAGGASFPDPEEIELGDGRHPQAVASGRFDGDDYEDVVVVNEVAGNITGTVTCLRGSPDGLSGDTCLRGSADGPPDAGMRELPVGRSPRAVASGDFNHDGFDDVIVANAGSGTVCCLLGGLGGLSPAGEPIPVGVVPDASGVPPGSAAGGDDVAITTQLVVEVGDFDGDDIDDAVVASGGTGKITCLRGGQDGLSAVRRTDILVGGYPIALLPLRLEDKEVDDLLVASAVSDTVTYLRGGSDGLSEEGVTFDVTSMGGRFPRALATGDFNGDGALDVAVANRDSGNVMFLLGRRLESTGNEFPFLRPSEAIEVGNFPAEASPEALTVEDYNGDGLEDLLVVNTGDGSISYVPGSRERLRPLAPIEVGSAPYAILTEDLNHDSFPDVVVANLDSSSVTFLEGEGAGLVRWKVVKTGRTSEERSRPVALLSRDFNQDDFSDLVVANAGNTSQPLNSSVSYHRGKPGGFAEPSLHLVAGQLPNRFHYPSALVTGDFDGSGCHLDVVAAFENSDEVTFFAGGGDADCDLSPDRSISREAGNVPKVLAAADFDGDGRSDLLVGHERDPEPESCEGEECRKRLLYFAGGSGFPGEPQPIEISSVPVRAIAVDDFDGDGDLDAAVAHGGALTFLEGVPGGALPLVFSEEYDVATIATALTSADFDDATNATALTSADFDADGVADLAAIVSAGNALGMGAVIWFRGSTALDGVAVESPTAVASGDVNGDGFIDLVVAGIVVDGDEEKGQLTLLPGSAEGLVGDVADPLDIPNGRRPVALDIADYDGDGFPDVVVVNEQTSGTISFFKGGPAGLTPTGSISTQGTEPAAVASGDFNGDRFLDLAVANRQSNDVTLFLQAFRAAHENRLVDPEGDDGLFEDPREPRRYRLDLDPVGETLEGLGPTQVCLVPSVLFPLPRGEASETEGVLVPVTDTVTVLPEELELQRLAFLTLRVRDGRGDGESGPAPQSFTEEVMANPDRLRVYRRDASTGLAVRSDIEVIDVEEFEDGLGVTFPIDLFGTYVVVTELERGHALLSPENGQ